LLNRGKRPGAPAHSGVQQAQNNARMSSEYGSFNPATLLIIDKEKAKLRDRMKLIRPFVLNE